MLEIKKYLEKALLEIKEFLKGSAQCKLAIEGTWEKIKKKIFYRPSCALEFY